jgi:hypothetical protein
MSRMRAKPQAPAKAMAEADAALATEPISADDELAGYCPERGISVKRWQVGAGGFPSTALRAVPSPASRGRMERCILLALDETQDEVVSGPALGATAAGAVGGGCGERRLGLVEGKPGGEDRLIACGATDRRTYPSLDWMR